MMSTVNKYFVQLINEDKILNIYSRNLNTKKNLVYLSLMNVIIKNSFEC